MFQVLQQPPAGAWLHPQEGTQEEARRFGGDAIAGSLGVSGPQHNRALFTFSFQRSERTSAIATLYAPARPSRWGIPGSVYLLRGRHRWGGDGPSSEKQRHQEEITESAGAEPENLPGRGPFPDPF